MNRPIDQRVAQFTPGPWEVEEGGHSGPTLVGANAEGGQWGEWIICDMSLPTDLVGLNEDNLSREIIDQQTANARLIAAAPDLYEALAAVDQLVSDMPGFLGARVRAALAKARGEQS